MPKFQVTTRTSEQKQTRDAILEYDTSSKNTTSQRHGLVIYQLIWNSSVKIIVLGLRFLSEKFCAASNSNGNIKTLTQQLYVLTLILHLQFKHWLLKFFSGLMHFIKDKEALLKLGRSSLICCIRFRKLHYTFH